MGKIVTIDCEYQFPGYACAYLLTDAGRAAFIETGTLRSVPKLMGALAAEGLGPEQVDWIIPTHAHLDHAGGAWALMEACPGARLLAHPRAAKHLTEPSKLVRGVRAVYGDAEFERLYGEIRAIDARRVSSPGDGEKVALGRGELQFLHARGHANHHFCVLDRGSETLFAGDAFGLRYPRLQGRGRFIFPSTSPVDFDYESAVASIQRIEALGTLRVALTHYGVWGEIAASAADLIRELEFYEALRIEATGEYPPGAGDSKAAVDEARTDFCRERVRARFDDFASAKGFTESDMAFLDSDIRLNADGIAWAAGNPRSPKAN